MPAELESGHIYRRRHCQGCLDADSSCRQAQPEETARIFCSIEHRHDC